MSEMVERVSSAILRKVPTGYGMTKPEADGYARAAIEAMREPTEAMIDAAHYGEAPGEPNSFSESWEQAIDEVLRDSPE